MTHGGSPQDGGIASGVAREREALARLFSLADAERGVGWGRPGIDERWGVARTRALLDLLGAPDRRMRCVLVAGTKGKGSTVAFLASVLHAAGVSAGMYTQPHLQSYRERVRVDGEAVAPARFADLVEDLWPHVEGWSRPEMGRPTTFEVTTAVALAHFARSGCGVALLEVGLGGRLDATNAVEPDISVITPISRDHMAVLGTTLARIAREKAGILRRGRLALLAEQRPTAASALRAACRATGAHCQVVPPLRDAILPLAGEHQRQNAALAGAAARALGIVEPAIRRGLEAARWPGRFEVLPGSPTVVLDGAHNDASAAALARTLAGFAEGRPIVLVLGVHRDKEVSAVLRPLVPVAAAVFVTATASPRALPAASLASAARALAPVPVSEAPDVPGALAAARAAAGSEGIVCVTGSLALVGEARDALGLSIVERLWS